jgi:hypothetical protein
MNVLSRERRVRAIACLVEGSSIRSTVRITGIAKNTVAKLLVDIGRACTEYQDKALRNLPCKRIHCDEIWSFVGSKEKNTSPEKKAKITNTRWPFILCFTISRESAKPYESPRQWKRESLTMFGH